MNHSNPSHPQCLLNARSRIQGPRLRLRWSALLSALLGLFLVSPSAARAQIYQTVFEDDFASGTIDPAKYLPDAPFFEGGVGDIHAQPGNGTMEFVGTTTQQWWSGATLRLVPLFEASEKENLVVSIDRVAEAGVGTASRSALWILDETRTKYVLFADVRAEGGWRYNRKIGEDGDAPTGSGTDIVPFNGETFDDGGLHRMKVVANGQTVKLYLDDQMGVEVKFPFPKVVVEFGSYARANDDTAATTWDNLKIENARETKVLLEDDFASNAIDPALYVPDAPFFEGGVGDIAAQAGNGVIEFVGTTTQQWWAGATLRVVPTYPVSEQTTVAVSIDRVAEAGVGSASRSALWILDETRTKYVLFADVRAEGGWRYNRKIGEDGDVPTGSGTDIAAFNGGTFDDGGLQRMSVVADGKTVKLYLNGLFGAEVKFPFPKIVVEFGSYARANNDTASTTWDNLRVETTVRQTSVVFADDFSSNTIDPAKYVPDAPFFEGGVGDIAAQAGNGVIEFVGTTTQQWWAGATLRVVPTFTAAEDSILSLSIDRVAEAGVGTASRSALWIMDESRTKYVLFADVRGEGGWHYNRKIGEDGDVPTGGGVDIPAFNGASFDDGGLHRMGLVADGKTVKLLLDGQEGAEVKFPFSPVVFEFGSYARANGDTAGTTWDNLVIETAGGATFDPKSVSVRLGQSSGNVTVKIPAGLNSQGPVQVRVVSANPAVAEPHGGTDGVLTLTFPAGAPNTQTIRVRGISLGGTKLTLEGDVAAGNELSVAVISGPGIQLEENFAGAIAPAKWQVSTAGFETGTGTYTVAANNGMLEISGTTDVDFWPGASLKSVNSFVATPDLLLSVEVDRVLIDQFGTAGRTGLYLTTADRTKFVFLGQNVGENNWHVNVNPGSPTGAGTALGGFAAITDTGNHRLRLVANGETVEVFVDGVSGGRFSFPVSTGIFVELGAYARASGDTVLGQFDNVRVENLLPCTEVSPVSVSMTHAESGRPFSLTVPALLHDAEPLVVTITSQNPAVAVPEGAVNGVLTLNFGVGAANTQTVNVKPVGLGATTFSISSAPQNCVSGNLSVEVVAVPQVFLTDDFPGSAVDTGKWRQDETPFDTGTIAFDGSGIVVENGLAKINVTAESSLWPGLALYTANTYSASQTEPVTFEIDRVAVGFVLTTGTGAEQRTGAWVREAGGNFVFLSDYIAHDGRNFGWRYNKMNGQADDDAVGAGVNIPAFEGGTFDDRGRHRMKLVANGATVKLFVDGIFGAEVPFAFSTGLSFGFGAYVDETANVVRGEFDNALITGGATAVPPKLSVSQQGENIVITWTGSGVLESNGALGSTGWTDVSPAPVGNSLTLPPESQGQVQFYRLR